MQSRTLEGVATPVGQRVQYATYSGVYIGVALDEEDGVPYHYFVDGEINGIPQTSFGFPATKGTPTTTSLTPTQLIVAVNRAMREIREDVRSGHVPADVQNFSELHDYVDANEYGGICDDEVVRGMSDDEFMTLGIDVQDVIDGWIKSGGLR